MSISEGLGVYEPKIICCCFYVAQPSDWADSF